MTDEMERDFAALEAQHALEVSVALESKYRAEELWFAARATLTKMIDLRAAIKAAREGGR